LELSASTVISLRLGETCAGHQTDVTRSNDRQLHGLNRVLAGNTARLPARQDDGLRVSIAADSELTAC
jgi:hypothetical protein